MQNDLLAALSPKTQQRLFSLLEPCNLPLGKVLFERGEALTHIYFPSDAVVSLMYVMQNGYSVEVASVGREGLVGVALLTGSNSTPTRAVVQSAGSALRLPVNVLTKELDDHDDLLRLTLRYTQCLITQMTQIAVCNHCHSLDQQFCRWLLVTLDRLTDNEMNIRHFLNANMLVARRSGINEVVEKLQKAGVIKHARGHISVLNRKRLEELCCECYRMVKSESSRLLGSARKSARTSARRSTSGKTRIVSG